MAQTKKEASQRNRVIWRGLNISKYAENQGRCLFTYCRNKFQRRADA